MDSMFYDVAGNLRKTRTRRAHVIQTWYDSRNRDTTTSIPGIGDLKHAYGGPVDQVTRLWYANDVDSIGGVNRAMSWVYDQRGRLKADTVFTGTTGRATLYHYDAYERVDSVVDASGTWKTQFDANLGVPTTAITPFQDTVVYTYDDHLRPTGPTIRSSGPQQTMTPVWFETGLLDSAAHRVSTSPSTFTPLTYHSGTSDEPSFPSVAPFYLEQHGTGATLDTLRDSVQYDGWERVTAVVSWRGKAIPVNVVARDTFAFDRLGNIRTSAGAEVYDAMTGQLRFRVRGIWSDSLVYDSAGNLDSMVSKKTSGGAVTHRWGFDWDVLNRLVTVRYDGTRIARYSYDVLGRRIAKRVYRTLSGAPDSSYMRFVYHGDHVAFEADSSNHVGRRYVWGMGTDDLLAVQDTVPGQARVQYYTAKDKLGSTRGLVKRDGTWKSSERFGPYGAQIESFGTDIGHRYRWTGREYDAETGFYYFRARYYEPAARRFVQEDPIGYAGGGNLYQYAEGMVQDGRDPSGLIVDLNEQLRLQALATESNPNGGSINMSWDGSMVVSVFGGGSKVRPTFYVDGVEVGMSGLPADNAIESITRGTYGAPVHTPGGEGRGRRLSGKERSRLGDGCKVIDCSKVQLIETSGVPQDMGFTLGNDIYLHDTSHDVPIALLAHEMVHVWQFQQKGALDYYLTALWESMIKRAFTDVYRYTPGLRFGQYHMEQQGMIMQHCAGGIASACAVPGLPFHPK
jgi:RHS repeat-associated protein